jgi:hypothetical protein
MRAIASSCLRWIGWAAVTAAVPFVVSTTITTYDIFALGRFDPKFGDAAANFELGVYLLLLLAGVQFVVLILAFAILLTVRVGRAAQRAAIASVALTVLNLLCSPLHRMHPFYWAIGLGAAAVAPSALLPRANART